MFTTPLFIIMKSAENQILIGFEKYIYPLDVYYIVSKMCIYEPSALVWKIPYAEKHDTIQCLQQVTNYICDEEKIHLSIYNAYLLVIEL